jgi:AraC-like DNA-binding protein
VSVPPQLRFFFIHIMKTGGGTFVQHIRANFERDEVYPCAELDPERHNPRFNIRYLTALPPERLARIRLYMGHFPFLAAQLLGVELVTITILRDPVERTISFLKHCKRYNEHHHALSLEHIYEDTFQFWTLIRNHQTKLFAMTRGDNPESYLDFIEIDDGRLEIAKTNLERVDVLGLQERFPELLEDLVRRYGWHVGSVRNFHVSRERQQVSRSFRRRIAEDNATDLEFYEYAQGLYEARRAGR